MLGERSTNVLVHSILFNNKVYTTTTARKWLKEHNYSPIKRVDVTTNYLRYRIRDPKEFKSFVTKEITNDITFVFGISK